MNIQKVKTDKVVKSGKNENGVSYEILKDHSIGDFYLQIEGSSRPSATGTKSYCQAVANGFEK